MAIGKHKHDQRPVLTQAHELHMLDRCLVLWRQNKRCPAGDTGQGRADTIQHACHVRGVAAEGFVDLQPVLLVQVTDLQKTVNEHSQSALCRYSASADMRAAQKTQIFQILHHVANSRGADLFGHCARQRPATHRVTAFKIAFDDAAKNFARPVIHLV